MTPNIYILVFAESEKDRQLENVHVSSYRQQPQLKLVTNFGNLNIYIIYNAV